MRPNTNQELPDNDSELDGEPSISPSPERPIEPAVKRGLRNEPAVSVGQSEFGPIPNVAAQQITGPLPLWSDAEMVSDAEAAQEIHEAVQDRRVFRVSYGRLTLLLIAFGLAGFGVHHLHERQLGTTAAAFRQQADRARQQGQQDLYLRYLKQYIGYNDKDIDALVEFATAMSCQVSTLAENKYLLTLVERACEREPERHDARRRLVGVAMELGQYQQALSNLGLLEKVTPDDGTLKLLIGRCYEQQKGYSAAIAAFRASIACLPQQIDAYQSLARLLRSESQGIEQSLKVLDQMVIANGQSPEALILRSRFRLSAGDIGGSVADIRSACEVAPDLPEAHLMVARLAAVGGITDSGELQSSYDQLKRTIDLNPEDLELHQSLALLDQKLGRIPVAEEWLRRGLQLHPHSYRARFQLILLLVMTGDIDKAQGEIKLLATSNEPFGSATLAGKCLSAFGLMQVQNWRQAAKKLEKILPQLSNEPELKSWADNWLARCFFETREHDSEIAVLRRILDRDATAIPPRRALAHVLAEKGNLDDAIGHLSMHWDDADVAPELLNLKFRRTIFVSADSESLDGIDQTLRLAGNSTRSPWSLILLKARIDEARSGVETAIQHLREAIARSPDQLELQLVLAMFALRSQDNALARETLESAGRRFTNDVRIDSAWIHYWTWQDADDAWHPMTAMEASLEGRPEPERRRLAVQLARAWVLRGFHEKAEHLWHQLAAQQPGEIRLQLLAFESSLNSGNWASAAADLLQIEAIDEPDGEYIVACRVAEMVARTEAGDFIDADEVRLAFRRLEKLRPNWHVVSALQGRIFQEEAQPRRAEECFRAALENGSCDVTVLARLLTLLCRRDEYQLADLAVQQFEPYWDGRWSQLDPAWASDIAEQAGNPEHARALARKWGSAESENSLSGATNRIARNEPSENVPQDTEIISDDKYNLFGAEILFSDPDLEYRLIFEETTNPDGTPSRNFGSVSSLYETLLLTEAQIAFFNAFALNAGSIDDGL